MEHSFDSKTKSYCNEYDMNNDADDDEYYDYIDNGLSSDYDPSLPLEPFIPFKKHSLSCSSDGNSTDNNIYNMNDEKTQNQTLILESDCNDALELFFDTFFDAELDGEITICQFLSVLNELYINITEKEIYAMFNYIDIDRSGFIDAVDFANFCTTQSFDDDSSHIHSEQKYPDIKRLQNALNSVIDKHPFMMATADPAL